MNTAGLAILVRMGNCFCFNSNLSLNGKKFRIHESLGEGGFSTVDLVEDIITHKLYALKRITCHSPQDEKIAISEIEYYKCFSNPYIIECIDFDMVGVPDMIGNTTSQVRILLPYCQRGNLQDELMRHMKNKTHLDEVVILTMFRNICEGVVAMHSMKPYPLAHRDLKAANILLKNDLSPIIMDFGSMTRAQVEVTDSKTARQIQDEAAERSFMPYRAPELFNVEQQTTIDERTDVWAVYERGDSVALAVVSGRVTFPENHSYSEDLIELIQSLITVNPEERPFVDWVLHRVDELLQKATGAV